MISLFCLQLLGGEIILWSYKRFFSKEGVFGISSINAGKKSFGCH